MPGEKSYKAGTLFLPAGWEDEQPGAIEMSPSPRFLHQGTQQYERGMWPGWEPPTVGMPTGTPIPNPADNVGEDHLIDHAERDFYRNSLAHQRNKQAALAEKLQPPAAGMTPEEVAQAEKWMNSAPQSIDMRKAGPRMDERGYPVGSPAWGSAPRVTPQSRQPSPLVDESFLSWLRK